MTSPSRLATIVLMVVSMLLFSSNSQAHASNSPIITVSHIDIIPDYAKPKSEESAAVLLRKEKTASEHDAGLVSYMLLQQVGSSNHFTIVETWRDVKSYEAHQGSDHTVRFRKEIEPFLGSPFDSRPNQPF